MNKVPCRKMFTETIEGLAKEDKDIIVVTSDATGSATLDSYVKNLPEQFVEVGIAEQDGVGISAGLSTYGKKVFYFSPASFLAARSFEQIKVDVGYANSKVRLIGISGGVSYGSLGLTHHSVNDIAAIRSLPNVDIVLPCDRWQTKLLTEYLAGDIERPVYVRLGRGAVEDVYTEENAKFEFGKAHMVCPGSDITIIAAGEMVYPALKASSSLTEKGISVRVLNMHTIKPLDSEAILKAAKETKAIITIEEHTILGGLGGAVAEVICQSDYRVPMRILGLPNTPVVTGSSSEVFNYYGLNEQGLIKTAQEILK